MPRLNDAEGPTSPDPKNQRESAPNQRQSAAKKSRRGGKRPGAGAPKGNLNALKHGRRSRQFAEIGAALANSPAMRQALLLAAARHGVRQATADELAFNLLHNTLARAANIRRKANARLSDTPTTDDGRAINENQPNQAPAKHKTALPKKSKQPINQKTSTNPSGQSPARYENTND